MWGLGICDDGVFYRVVAGKALRLIREIDKDQVGLVSCFSEVGKDLATRIEQFIVSVHQPILFFTELDEGLVGVKETVFVG